MRLFNISENAGFFFSHWTPFCRKVPLLSITKMLNNLIFYKKFRFLFCEKILAAKFH